MKDKKEIDRSNTTNKKPSSLVLKLNAKMLGRQLGGFLSLNLVIFILGLFLIFLNIESGASSLIKTLEVSPDYLKTSLVSASGYELLDSGQEIEGYKVPKTLVNMFQNQILGNSFEGQRSINRIKIPRGAGFLEKLDYYIYNIKIQSQLGSYYFKYELGRDFLVLARVFLVLFVAELVILLTNIARGARSIKRTLMPITELSETAKSLSDRLESLASGSSQRQIKDLAGAISNIDADMLDKGISIDSTQEELRDLSLAINKMLNRINASYQSQIRFVSDASHELRTPISVIQGYINLLDRWGKEDKKVLEESIAAIKSETQTMKDLVEHLLFLARGDNETINLHLEDFDLSQLIEEIARETQLIDDGHKLELDLEEGVIFRGDRQLVKQGVRILVDNSIKFTPQGKKIILKLAREDGNLKIVVEDRGIGIDPQDLPLIFDRFYRSDESRARKTGGSGLGLSIASWIIKHHGGHFEVLSRLDVGSRITIKLPDKTIEELGEAEAY